MKIFCQRTYHEEKQIPAPITSKNLSQSDLSHNDTLKSVNQGLTLDININKENW
jgi:hypothetical protein